MDTLTGQQVSDLSRERNLTQAEHDAFRAHLRQEYGTGVIPGPVDNALYSKAWDDGHSNGYGEVECCYGNLAELVITAYVAGTKGN